MNFIEAKRKYSHTLVTEEKQYYNKIQLSLQNSKNAKEFYQALNVFRNIRGTPGIKKQIPIEPVYSLHRQKDNDQ